MRRFQRAIAAAALIAATLGAALVCDTALTWLCLVPWMIVIRRTGLLCCVAVGGLTGVFRLTVVLGPLLAVADRPWAAWVVGAAYLAVAHGVFAAGAFWCVRLRHPLLAAGLTGAIVWLLDLWLCLGPLPACQFTTAYAIAGSNAGLGLARWIGPLAVGLPVGALACVTSGIISTKRGCVGVLALAAALLLADLVPPRGAEAGTRIVRIACVPTPSLPGELQRADALEADLIILPENVAKRYPLKPAKSDDLQLEPLLDTIAGFRHQTPTLLGVVERGPDDYRNAVLLYANGQEATVDKRRGIPGCEIAAFSDWPIARSVVSLLVPVTSKIRLRQGRSRTLDTGSLRVSANVCFDHSCLSTWRAWGADDQFDSDLLVCVARLYRLSGGARWECVLSRRARRLHAVNLGRPLVYVSDLGSELDLPDGQWYVSTCRDLHTWEVRL
jgi:hypothetical protein